LDGILYLDEFCYRGNGLLVIANSGIVMLRSMIEVAILQGFILLFSGSIKGLVFESFVLLCILYVNFEASTKRISLLEASRNYSKQCLALPTIPCLATKIYFINSVRCSKNLKPKYPHSVSLFCNKLNFGIQNIRHISRIDYNYVLICLCNEKSTSWNIVVYNNLRSQD